MKPLIQLLYSPICVLLLVSFVQAQSESERIAKQISPYLNENIALLVHVDLEKINLDQLDADLRPLLHESAEKFALFNTLEEIDEQIENYKAVAKASLTMAKSVYGVRDIYFLVNPSLFPDSFGYFIVPLKDSRQVEAAMKNPLIAEERTATLGSDLVLFLPGINSRREKDKDVEVLREKLQAQSPTPRADFFTALKSVEDSTAQVVLFPSLEMRRILGETVETLPAPLEKTPVSIFTRGVHWSVLAVDARKLSCDFIVQSEQNQAAKDLRDVIGLLLEKSFDHLETTRDYKVFLESYQIEPEEIRTIARELLPEVKGDQLRLSVDKETLLKNSKRAIDLSAVTSDVALSRLRVRQCEKNLLMIGLAFHTYYDCYKELPAACRFDEQKKPLHSWRVALLPFLEQGKLYESIRLDEPWDSEHNKQFHTQCPAVFQCPQAAAKNPEIVKKGLTTYSLIVGKNAFPPDGSRFEFRMITDGLSNTVVVVERQKPVCWMDPTQEITQENAMKGVNKIEDGISAPHSFRNSGGTLFGMFDGSSHMVSEKINQKLLEAVITRNGGEHNYSFWNLKDGGETEE